MSSKFGIFEGFGWVVSLSVVDEPGFRGDQISGFLDLRLVLAHFWQRGSNPGFKVQYICVDPT